MPSSRASDTGAHRDPDHFDADQDRWSETGVYSDTPRASQREMVAASLGATHHPDTYARRRTFPTPRTGDPMAVAPASPRHSAGGPSSPATRAPRLMTAAPGGSPTTTPRTP